jgi:hypothetical protein
MSRKPLIGSVVLGFALTLTSVASARRPPALVATQERVAGIFATCPQARETSGYRDMLARFSARAATPLVGARDFAAPPQKMRDHVVLSCSGGTVHSGSGYRDMLWRFPSKAEQPLIAGPASSGRIASRRP